MGRRRRPRGAQRAPHRGDARRDGAARCARVPGGARVQRTLRRAGRGRRADAVRARSLRPGRVVARRRLRGAPRARGASGDGARVGGAPPPRARAVLRRAGSRDPRGAVRAYERDARARGRRRRARTHRHRVAVAARGDVPEDAPLVQHSGALHGRVPRVPLRMLAGAAVRVDQGTEPRPVGADPGKGRERAVRPGRRDVDRARLQHPVRRVARAAAPARPALLRARARHPLHGAVGAGRVRLQRPAAAAHAQRRHHALPHAEALVEPVQQAGREHARLAGHRRQRGARALPAGGRLQQHGASRRAREDRARVQEPRPLRHEHARVRATATAAAVRRARCSRRSGVHTICRGCRERGRAPRGSSSTRSRPRARRGRSSSASSTSSTTAARTRRRRS